MEASARAVKMAAIRRPAFAIPGPSQQHTKFVISRPALLLSGGDGLGRFVYKLSIECRGCVADGQLFAERSKLPDIAMCELSGLLCSGSPPAIRWAQPPLPHRGGVTPMGAWHLPLCDFALLTRSTLRY